MVGLRQTTQTVTERESPRQCDCELSGPSDCFIIVLLQGIQAGYKLLRIFPCCLAAMFKSCPLKDHILPHLEEPIILFDNCFVLFPFIVGDVGRGVGVLCIFPHAVHTR